MEEPNGTGLKFGFRLRSTHLLNPLFGCAQSTCSTHCLAALNPPAQPIEC
ncbi:MAG: hypothetical protein HC827_12150 [Cyanobacteria bacterium RM1_2_2]|nr:hypothetical protein [Cyanobacteria bacterium RM1_2_2]